MFRVFLRLTCRHPIAFRLAVHAQIKAGAMPRQEKARFPRRKATSVLFLDDWARQFDAQTYAFAVECATTPRTLSYYQTPGISR